MIAQWIMLESLITGSVPTVGRDDAREWISWAPLPALAGVVSGLDWYRNPVEPTRLERSVPDGAVTLMVNLAEDEFRVWDVDGGPPTARRSGGAVLIGPRSTPTVIDTAEQRHLLSVSFAWGGAAAFVGVPVGELRDELVDLDLLWGRDGALLRERVCAAPDARAALRILQDTLLAQLLRAPEPDPGVRFAVGALHRGEPVAAVADRLGWTGKRLLRRFRAEVGLSPKRFARVRRLQRVVRGLPAAAAVDWAEVATRHGYCDQAHLIGDFRELAGLTPAAYLAAVGPEPNHVPLDFFANPR